MTALIVHCTCPDADTADRLALALVEERLAACVGRLPGLRSVYRWEGAIERADEVLLLVKTTTDRFAALAARVADLHPYELPELIAVEVRAGLPGYLGWIAAETTPESTDAPRSE